MPAQCRDNDRWNAIDPGTDSDEEKERERDVARARTDKLNPDEKKKSNQAFTSAFSNLFKHKYPDLAPPNALDEPDRPPKVDLFESGGCDYCGEACWAKKQCGRCRSVTYCSGSCQKKHWKDGHRDACEARPEDCGQCGEPIPAKLKCGFCRAVYYCGSKCQRDHWRHEHRRECTKAHKKEPPPPPPKAAAQTPAPTPDDEEPPQVALTQAAQAAQAAGDLAVAEDCFRRALAATEDAFDREDDSVAAACANYGAFLAKRGRYDESDPLLARAQEIYEDAAGGAEDPSAILVKSWIADNARMRYDLDTAEVLFREILASSLDVYGECHAEVAVALNNLAGVLTEQGTATSWPEAKKHGRRALDVARATLGDDHPKTRAYAKSWENP